MQVQVFWQDQLGNGYQADYADRAEAEHRLNFIEQEKAHYRAVEPTYYGVTDWRLDCEAEALRLALGIAAENSFFRHIACALRRTVKTPHAEIKVMQAAPDLLAALETMQGWFNHPEIRCKMCDGGSGNLGEQSAYHSMMRAARAAIAKARRDA